MPTIEDISMMLSNSTPHKEKIYILYVIDNTLTATPNMLYILISFCQIEYVYTIVVRTGNTLQMLVYVIRSDNNNTKYTIINTTISL